MVKIRLKFSKRGPVRFIGHLDLMRYFQKVNRRAEIDVKYSEGYSPHQVMSFAEPLSVGATSDGEYLDMQMNSETDPEVVAKSLNGVMNEGITVICAERLPDDSEKAMTLVDAAEWILSFREGKEPAAGWVNDLRSYLGRDDLPAVKKTKKGETTINMKPLIYRAEVVKKAEITGFANPSYRYTDSSLSDDSYCVHLLVSSGSSDHLKPVMVIENFMKDKGQELMPNAVRIHRVDTYLKRTDDQGTYEIPMIHRGENKIYI
jgi:radical SAM-linked protein